MTTSAIQMCRVIISACLYLKLGWTCYSASKYTLCTNENNLKRWEEVGIIHYPDKGLAHLGGSSVVHCRSVLRCGAGSSFQGKHSVVLGSHFLNIPRNVLVLIFPVPSQPAALNELKFTWFITDNTNLLPSCCSPLSEVALSRSLHLPAIPALFQLISGCVCEGQAQCPAHWGVLFMVGQSCCALQVCSCLPAAATGLWELCWKMRQGITQEWENLIFEQSGILGMCGLPTQPFFLQTLHSYCLRDFPVLSWCYLSPFNSLYSVFHETSSCEMTVVIWKLHTTVTPTHLTVILSP